MNNKAILYSPAKLNIFLKVLGKRKDGYHQIRSGITFLNIFDKIELEESNENSIYYDGVFGPKNGLYEDCIIKKTLIFLKIYDKFKFKISVNKNIPVQGGLGSGSSNAATIIRYLEKKKLIKQKPISQYSVLGADIPCFLYKKN